MTTPGTFTIERFGTTTNYRTLFDVSEMQPAITGQTYYVDPVNGVDTNDGLTVGTALKAIKTAMNKSDAGLVLCEGGDYSRNFTMDLVNLNGRDIVVKPRVAGQTMRLHAMDSFTWTKTGGRTHVYQTARTSIYGVHDWKYKDGNGDDQVYVSVADVAACDATAGSYYTDGTTVYVHTSDNRVPDTDVRIHIGVSTCAITNAGKVYFENVEFFGARGLYVTGKAGGGAAFYGKNMYVRYARARNGAYNIQDVDEVIFQNCKGARSENDGFNYHSTAPRIVKALEINCIGRHNGETSDSDNGSTMHDGGHIIRFKGLYHDNKGPNCVDINDGTKVWNVDCDANDSQASDNTAKTGFHIGDSSGGTTTAWLENCRASGNAGGDLAVRSGHVANVRGGSFGTENIAGTKNVY